MAFLVIMIQPSVTRSKSSYNSITKNTKIYLSQMVVICHNGSVYQQVKVKGGEGLIADFSLQVNIATYRETLRFCLHHPSPPSQTRGFMTV